MNVRVWILVGCDSDGKPDFDKLKGVYGTHKAMSDAATNGRVVTNTDDGDGDGRSDVFCYDDGTSALAVSMRVEGEKWAHPTDALLADRYPTSLVNATVRFFGGQLNGDGARHLLGAIEYAVRTGPTEPTINDFVVELGRFLRRED